MLSAPLLVVKLVAALIICQLQSEADERGISTSFPRAFTKAKDCESKRPK